MNQNIYTVINSDFGSNISETINMSHITKYFSFCIENISIEAKKLDKFLDELKNNFDEDELKITNIELNAKSNTIYIHNNDYTNCSFSIIGSLYKNIIAFDIFTNSVELANNIFNILKKYQKEIENVYMDLININYSNGKFKFKNVAKYLEDFKDIKKSYYPYLDTDEFFKQYLKSTSNILILSGEMGVGKSKFVSLFLKYAMEHSEEYYKDYGVDTGDQYYFSTNLVKNPDALSDDLFWGEAINSTQLAVVFDDMDALLNRKDEIECSLDIQQNKFLNHLLTFSDGIIKDNNRTKIIITTNKSLGEIDPALLRSGRMFDILKFRSLSLEEAEDIWEGEELPFDKFKEYVKSENNEVRSSDLATGIEKLKIEIYEKKNFKPYCFEEGISTIREAKTSKRKIGLV